MSHSPDIHGRRGYLRRCAKDLRQAHERANALVAEYREAQKGMKAYSRLGARTARALAATRLLFEAERRVLIALRAANRAIGHYLYARAELDREWP